MRRLNRHGIPLVLATITPLFLTVAANANESSKKPSEEPGGDKHVSGMSIVGNDEAPKSLVIVPWKSSDLGDTLDVSKTLDDGRVPVDREVFRRSLDYYEIRTSSQP